MKYSISTYNGYHWQPVFLSEISFTDFFEYFSTVPKCSTTKKVNSIQLFWSFISEILDSVIQEKLLHFLKFLIDLSLVSTYMTCPRIFVVHCGGRRKELVRLPNLPILEAISKEWRTRAANKRVVPFHFSRKHHSAAYNKNRSISSSRYTTSTQIFVGTS